MIENKSFVITKENQFDKGWTILIPFDPNLSRCSKYDPVSVTDMVRSITRGSRICILLCEERLANAIIKELEWVSNYAIIELIAKTKAIVSRYDSIKFTKTIVDPDISINYIDVDGPLPLSVLIDETYVKSTPALRNVYFDKVSDVMNNSVFSDMEQIFFIGDCCGSKYADIHRHCLEHNIKTIRILDKDRFDKSEFDRFNGTKTHLLLSTRVKDAVIGIFGDGRFERLLMLPNGHVLPLLIERIDTYFGDLYDFVQKGSSFSLHSITDMDSKFVWYDGQIMPFVIMDKMVIERTFQVSSMSDFILDSFDFSEVNDHNSYSSIAKSVEYRFTFVPPLIDDTFVYSDVYMPIIQLKEKMDLIPHFNFIECIRFIEGFLPQAGLMDVFKRIVDWNQWFSEAVCLYDYRGYHSRISDFLQLLLDTRDRLFSYCEEMFIMIDSESLDTKFDKFDDEIDGYVRQVSEKKALIDQGIDVLKNTGRVKTLEKKIMDLQQLKVRFQGTGVNRNGLQIFLQKCKGLIDEQSTTVIDEGSISHVLDRAKETKMTLLESFVETYLLQFQTFMNNCIPIVEGLLSVSVPEDYQVFEKDGQRYIVIDNVNEYEATRAIQKEYGLFCLTRG